MALWRFGRGWGESEMRAYLIELKDRPVNFDVPAEEMTAANGWTIDGSRSSLGAEAPGPPLSDGLFAHARQGIINYDFSDPSIVVGHFDPEAPLVGRNFLLELKVLGFRFLSGCRVIDVREDVEHDTTHFGFRYDTLQGHIEQGFEWFLLSKDHATGDVDFRIEAHWRLGDFPNWWSRVGFLLIGNLYRRLWRHRAPARLKRLARHPVPEPVAAPGALAHRGGEVSHPSDPGAAAASPSAQSEP